MERMSAKHRLIGTKTLATEIEIANLPTDRTAIGTIETDGIAIALLIAKESARGNEKGRRTENGPVKETGNETVRGRKNAKGARNDPLSAAEFSWERHVLPIVEETVAVIVMMVEHAAAVIVPIAMTRRRTRHLASNPPCSRTLSPPIPASLCQRLWYD